MGVWYLLAGIPFSLRQPTIMSCCHAEWQHLSTATAGVAEDEKKQQEEISRQSAELMSRLHAEQEVIMTRML